MKIITTSEMKIKYGVITWNMDCMLVL